MNILICGSGPAAVQFGILAKRAWPSASLSYWARPSRRNRCLHAQFLDKQLTFRLITGKSELQHLCGEITPDVFSTSSAELHGHCFDIIVLSTPVFTYHTLVEELLLNGAMSPSAHIITASSNLGTGEVLSHLLERHPVYSSVSLLLLGDLPTVTVRCPSTDDTFVLVDGKEKVRIFDSRAPASGPCRFLTECLSPLRAHLQVEDSSWAVEQANTNLFHIPIIVHPSLTQRFFDPESPPTLLYAPYPDGAMSYEVILNCARFEDELPPLYHALGLPPFDLLSFRLNRAKLSSFRVGGPNDFADSVPTIYERAINYSLYSWAIERRFLTVSEQGTTQLPTFPRITLNEGRATLPRIPYEDILSLQGILWFADKAGLDLSFSRQLVRQFYASCRHEPSHYGYELTLDEHAAQSVANCYGQALLRRSHQVQQSSCD